MSILSVGHLGSGRLIGNLAQEIDFMFANRWRRALIWVALPFTLLSIMIPDASAVPRTVTVSDTSNIIGAGHSVAPSPGGGGGGTLPPVFTFAANSGFVFRPSSVVGTTSLTPGYDGVNGEGSGAFSTNISSYGGISGIIDTNRSGFLVGVFLDDSEPVAGTEPARLSFASPENFTTLAPLLLQTFFIGDGKTDGGGVTQSFAAPLGATRLFFGFADAPNYTGLPGAFVDNSGRSISVSFDDSTGGSPPTAVALPVFGPAGIVLLCMGLLCAAAVRQRRQRMH
ncbi:hypothetical protein ELE36_07095 [Pseudolysobacter antarcticus]|uniref:Uncharacterized protein n=1 Tax=Pseudolysobacter antarcticus TaxID=2511995 RepID=A0A411HI04_9GAMM|nr:hypothetical protein [Pseudolysobacter antarcticus]QBB70149.1 hypothetical protein ELE36_07095 [Pseudolysobacter antarcticus]